MRKITNLQKADAWVAAQPNTRAVLLHSYPTNPGTVELIVNNNAIATAKGNTITEALTDPKIQEVLNAE
jgi:hypothetical protein